jgi:O-acetylserine/cysteine efflux transporter
MSSAALLLDESVSPLRWCAAALLVGGVALTSLAGTRRPRPATTEAAEPQPAGA